MSCDISASPASPELLARVRREAMVLACAIAGLHQTLSRMSQRTSGSCHPDGSGPHVADNAGPGGTSDGAPEPKSYVTALSVLGAAERSELLRVTTELLTLEAPADEAAEAAAEAAMAAAAAAEAAAAAAKARKLAERERKEQQRRQLAAAAEPGPGPATGSEVEAGAGTGAVAVASTHSTAGVTTEVPGVSSAASAAGPVETSASLPQAACAHEASVGPCAAGASPSSSQPAPPAVALGLPALEPGVCSSKPLDAAPRPSTEQHPALWCPGQRGCDGCWWEQQGWWPGGEETCAAGAGGGSDLCKSGPSGTQAGGTTQLPLLVSSETATEGAEHGHSRGATMAPPPLAVGPGGLLNPGYCRTGYLRRPYVLQLAWAAAGWRATGLFPYPAVRDGPGPPMLREGPGWAEALAEAEWLLPTLLPRVEPSASPAAARDATAHSHAPATPATPAQPPATPDAASPGTSCPQPPGPELQVPTSPVSLAPATDTAASDRSSEADPAVLCRLLLRAPLLFVLLGFRRTPGSAEALVGPPSAAQCWAAFEAPHEARGAATRLTVGARALSKHCNRDTRAEWWPQMSGPDPRKNAAARGALAGLLRGAVWLNLHTLPPFDAPIHVLELRTERGYGARWAVQGLAGPGPGSDPGPSSAAAGEAEAEAKAAADQDSAGGAKAAEAPGGMDQARADDSTERGAAAQRRWAVSFRGFLEPSMEGGHEAGWRH